MLNAFKWPNACSDSHWLNSYSSRFDEQWLLENPLLDSSRQSQLTIAVMMPTVHCSNQSIPGNSVPTGSSAPQPIRRSTSFPPKDPLNSLNTFPVSNMHLPNDATSSFATSCHHFLKGRQAGQFCGSKCGLWGRSPPLSLDAHHR